MTAANLPGLLQRFFTDRLTGQLQASPNTIASYRDTFRLLLRYASQRHNREPVKLRIEDLDSSLVGEFLAHVENVRKNSARSRNTRLAAIRSFYRFVALHEPEHALHCQRVLAMPSKRYTRRPIDFITSPEIKALISTPDQTMWLGRRDRTILLLALQTGLRVSELIGLRCRDIVLGPGAHVTCAGKGRKQRCTPLRRDSASLLEAWLKERNGRPDEPVFTTIRGDRLSRDAMEHIVQKHVTAASRACTSLAGKRVTPHVLRHSAAMELLQNGVDRSVIALWLGHESIETTQVYIHADMRLKEKALARVASTDARPGRYRPDDTLLSFLESL
jgi:site-specific recombinase XerD